MRGWRSARAGHPGQRPDADERPVDLRRRRCGGDPGLRLGRSAQVPLAGPANRQGRIAADNIFGRDSRFRGTQGTAIVGFFDLVAAVTGLSEKAARSGPGLLIEKVYIHANQHAGYYPGARQMAIKVLFEPGTGKLLGGQIVGYDGVDNRINVLAMAIQAGMTVFDLEEVELAYAPQFGSAKDPINMVGFVASNLVRGEYRAGPRRGLDGGPPRGRPSSTCGRQGIRRGHRSPAR